MRSDAESEETEESFVLDLLLNSTARMLLCCHSFIVPHFNLIMHNSWDTWLGRYSDLRSYTDSLIERCLDQDFL